LVEMRNDAVHERMPGHELARHRRQLALVLEQFLLAVPSLRSSVLVYAEAVSRERNGLEAFFRKFVGDGSPAADQVLLPLQSTVARRALYLRDSDGLFLEVSPFLFVANNEEILFWQGSRFQQSGAFACPYAALDVGDLQLAIAEVAQRAPFLVALARSGAGSGPTAVEGRGPAAVAGPMIPSPVAGGEVRRPEEMSKGSSVNAPSSQGTGRTLDIEVQRDPGAARFVEDARRLLPKDQLVAMTDLVAFSLARAASVTWGVTTSNRASFVPTFEGIGEPYSVYADGQVKLNYARLNRTEQAVRVRDLLAKRLYELLGTALSVNEFVACGPRKWTPKARSFIAVLGECLG
jgi:hypothetical protein